MQTDAQCHAHMPALHAKPASQNVTHKPGRQITRTYDDTNVGVDVIQAAAERLTYNIPAKGTVK